MARSGNVLPISLGRHMVLNEGGIEIADWLKAMTDVGGNLYKKPSKNRTPDRILFCDGQN